jgi:hypothetical protein
MCIKQATWIYRSLREKFTNTGQKRPPNKYESKLIVTDTGALSTFISLSKYKGLQCPLANCTLSCSKIKP